MDLYLDIDGVLLDRHGKPVLGVVEFLKWATENFTCFWLTTHCKGDTESCKTYLRGVLPHQAMWYVSKILPTDWQTLKTEAIIWNRDFCWLDDTILESERRDLERHEALHRFVKIDLEQNPTQLRDLTKKSA